MTTRPAARRLVTRIAPPLFCGGFLALTTTSHVGAPRWAVALAAVAGTLIIVLPNLLPQKSEHRRDAWRDWLRHRERMARLRIAAVNSTPRPQVREGITANGPAGRSGGETG